MIDPLTNQIRPLPSAEGAENSVLSCLMQWPEEFIPLAVEKGLQPQMFYIPSHRVLHRVLMDLYEAEKPIELISLTQHLIDQDLLENLGGPGELSTIYTHADTGTHFEHHIDLVKEKSFLRETLQFGNRLVSACYENNEDVLGMLSEPIDDLIASNVSGSKSATGKDAALAWYEKWEEQLEGGQDIGTIPCGVGPIDDSRGGLDYPGITVIGGFPGAGKTALFIQMLCFNLKTFPDARVLFFSLEMPKEKIIKRAMVHLCGFEDPNWINKPNQALRDWKARESAKGVTHKGNSPPKDVLRRMQRAMAILATDRLIIEDDGSQCINKMLSKAKIHMRKAPLTLVGIDYVQLAAGNSKLDSSERQTTELTNGVLRGMKMTKCPWVEISQLTAGKDKSAPTFKNAASILEGCDLGYRVMKEKEEKQVHGLKVVKDREGPTNGMTLPIDFDGAKQIFTKPLPDGREDLI